MEGTEPLTFTITRGTAHLYSFLPFERWAPHILTRPSEIREAVTELLVA